MLPAGRDALLRLERDRKSSSSHSLLRALLTNIQQVCKEVNGGLYWQHGAECEDLTVCVQPMFGEPTCEHYLADCWPWCSNEEKLAVQAAKNKALADEAAAPNGAAANE